jgi:hypothetical protein
VEGAQFDLRRQSMAVRLAVRHLPAASTVDSVNQLLEQAGLNPKQEQIKVQRVVQGKAETKIKAAIPSVAFVEVPNEHAAVRLCRVVEAQNLTCERAFIQRLPLRILSNTAKLPGAEAVQMGTWKEDPEFARFEASLKPKPKPVQPTAEEASKQTTAVTKPVESAALVEHFRKHHLMRHNRAQKQAKNDSKKRKPPTSSAATGGSDGAADKASYGQDGAAKQHGKQQQKKRPAQQGQGGEAPQKKPPGDGHGRQGRPNKAKGPPSNQATHKEGPA